MRSSSPSCGNACVYTPVPLGRAAPCERSCTRQPRLSQPLPQLGFPGHAGHRVGYGLYRPWSKRSAASPQTSGSEAASEQATGQPQAIASSGGAPSARTGSGTRRLGPAGPQDVAVTGEHELQLAVTQFFVLIRGHHRLRIGDADIAALPGGDGGTPSTSAWGGGPGVRTARCWVAGETRVMSGADSRNRPR